MDRPPFEMIDYMIKREITDEDRIAHDPFSGEEGDIKLRTVTIKRARKQHACFLSGIDSAELHSIQVGERYRHEKALVDNSFWGEYRLCLNCIDREIKQYFMDAEDE